MPITALSPGPRVGFWAAAWDHGESHTIYVDPPASSLTAGDRLFLWVDWYYERPSGIASITRTNPPGWTLVHTPVSSSTTSGDFYAQQTGQLWTREYGGAGDEFAPFTITVNGDGGTTAGKLAYTALGAHMFGFTGGRLEYVSDGRLPTVTYQETSGTASVGPVEANSLVLTYASHEVNEIMTEAPYLVGGTSGFTLDSSMYAKTAGTPAMPVVAARLRHSTAATLNGPGAVDGIVPVNGDRILLDQISPAYQRGIYRFNGVGVAMTRTADADTVTDVRRLIVDVTEGSSASRGRWSQYQYVNSLTAATPGGVPTRIAFRKNYYYVPHNARASKVFASADPIGYLPTWHVQPGNASGEDHAGWSLWKLAARSNRAGLGVTSGTVLGLSSGPAIR